MKVPLRFLPIKSLGLAEQTIHSMNVSTSRRLLRNRSSQCVKDSSFKSLFVNMTLIPMLGKGKTTLVRAVNVLSV